jgi:hypothetical protein
MTTRTALASVGVALVAFFVVGCDANTDISKAKNDDYHNHVPGPPPSAGAMKPKGPPVGPFAKTGGVPPNLPAYAPGPPKGDSKPVEAAKPGEPTKPTGK